MSRLLSVTRVALIAILVLAPGSLIVAQSRDKGPWWPSPHGAKDQAGNANYITPQKVMKAAQLVKTGQMYELGQIYEASMPAFGSRPYYINVVPAPGQIAKEGVGSVHQDYFNGYIGQMGTQFDAFGHMGRSVKMADGSVQFVYYNGFSEQDLTGRNRGQGGLEALGVEHVKPIITRGVLIDIAGAKGVPTLDAAYEVMMADVRAALARQKMTENSIEQGDAVLFNYGWAANWTNPSKYNDGRVGVGENKGSPGIGFEVARWLTERKVAMVGADSCCVMVMPESKAGNVHHELLLNGTYILENMNLLELARDQVYEFMYSGQTLRIKGATGSPVRPIAIR
ncbi:MAG: cyclase family protein [Vicinamibacterales bacterium]